MKSSPWAFKVTHKFKQYSSIKKREITISVIMRKSHLSKFVFITLPGCHRCCIDMIESGESEREIEKDNGEVKMIQQINRKREQQRRICSRTLLSTVIICHHFIYSKSYENFSSIVVKCVRLNHKILFIYLSELAVMQ
jgi:hypothetical protein